MTAHQCTRSRRHHHLRLAIPATLLLATIATTASAAICRVKTDGSSSGNGSDWSSQAMTLQTALAATNCSEIWVKEGVYTPVTPVDSAHVSEAERKMSFNIGPGVALYGGFAGTETSRAARDPTQHVTILSGDIDGNDFNNDQDGIDESTADIQGDNSYHVVYMDGAVAGPITASTVLDGVTVTAGHANGIDHLDKFAGGLMCVGWGQGAECSALIENVRFFGNRAFFQGGAAVCASVLDGVANPQFRHVVMSGNSSDFAGGAMLVNADTTDSIGVVLSDVAFHANSAAELGGAVAILLNVVAHNSTTFSNVAFTGNHAQLGGAIHIIDNDGDVSSFTLADATFAQNSAELDGGAIYNDHLGSPTMARVLFIQNTAGRDGGAMYNDGHGAGYNSSPVLTDASFENNSAVRFGGAMFNYGYGGGNSSPYIENVTFNGNSAQYGGAVYNDGYSGQSLSTLINVTFSGNTATTDGGAMYNNGSAGGVSSPFLRNVTFSDNHAWNNGGAILNGGAQGTSAAIFHNVILWNNIADVYGAEVWNIGAAPGFYNSIIAGSFGSGSNWNPAIGLDGGGNFDADPLLGTLKDNGGFTNTMIPGTGSPAINAIACILAPPTDQRGAPRPDPLSSGPTRCDIGAVEAGSDPDDFIFVDGFDAP